MHYTVISSENSSSCGGIFYNVPTGKEIDRIYKIVANKCQSCLEEKYKEDFEIYLKAKMRLEQELDLMKQTKCAFEFFLVEAIFQYSLNDGYPILLRGSLAGSFIAYLLGVSNINPIAPETWIDIEMVWKLKVGNIIPPNFEIGIASSIREGLSHFLNCTPDFYNIKANREIYKCLSMPHNIMCSEIGELMRKTNADYDGSVREEVANGAFQTWIDNQIEFIHQRIIEDGIKEKLYARDMVLLQEMRSMENVNKEMFTKLYAYFFMGYKGKKTLSGIRRADFHVFRDDLYSALLDFNISRETTAELVFYKIGHAVLCDNMMYVNQLAEYGVPKKLINYYRKVYNLWDKAACISRVNMYYILEWYKQNYPVEYEEVVNGGAN